MRSTLLFLVLACSVLAADPELLTIYLSDGRVLEKATITKYNISDVVVKHTRGVTVIRYEFLPEDIRADAETHRPGGSKQVAGKAAKNKRTVTGQLFITTRGAGSYKFTDVTVYALPLEAEYAWQASARPVLLPRPIAKATTNADGQFSLTVPAGQPFILWAQGGRLLGKNEAYYEWRRKSADIDELDKANLSGEHLVPRVPAKVEDWD